MFSKRQEKMLQCFSLLSSEKKNKTTKQQHKTSIVTIAIIMWEIELIKVRYTLVWRYIHNAFSRLEAHTKFHIDLTCDVKWLNRDYGDKSTLS